MPDLFNSYTNTFEIDPDKDYFEELVGEGKQYANQREFGKSHAHQSLHIARLEDEQRRLREDLSNRLRQEEFLNKLNQALLKDPQEPPENDKTKTSGISQEDLERTLELKMRERDAQVKAEQNLNLVMFKLEESLGPNYSHQLKKQASELGMSEQSLKGLASANPKAFFKLIGLDDKSDRTDPTFTSPPRTQSASSTTTKPSAKRGDSYYEEIRKTNPDHYWSPKIQNEMFDRIKEIGLEAFQNS